MECGGRGPGESQGRRQQVREVRALRRGRMQVSWDRVKEDEVEDRDKVTGAPGSRAMMLSGPRLEPLLGLPRALEDLLPKNRGTSETPN